MELWRNKLNYFFFPLSAQFSIHCFNTTTNEYRQKLVIKWKIGKKSDSKVKEMKALQDRNVWVEKNPFQPFRQ